MSVPLYLGERGTPGRRLIGTASLAADGRLNALVTDPAVVEAMKLDDQSFSIRATAPLLTAAAEQLFEVLDQHMPAADDYCACGAGGWGAAHLAAVLVGDPTEFGADPRGRAVVTVAEPLGWEYAMQTGVGSSASVGVTSTREIAEASVATWNARAARLRAEAGSSGAVYSSASLVRRRPAVRAGAWEPVR